MPSLGVRKQQAPCSVNSLRGESGLKRAEVAEGTSLSSQTAATHKPTAEGELRVLLGNRAATPQETPPPKVPQCFRAVPSRAEAAP